MIKSVWFWLLMLLPAALILRLCAQNIPGFADNYCGSVYRWVSLAFNNITGIVPFSLGEFILILLPAAVIVYIVFVIVRIVRSKGRRIRTFLKGLLRPLSVACAVLFLYVTNCGVNYYCTDFSTLSGLETRPVSADELYEVCVYLAKNASSLREGLDEGENGTMLLDISKAQKTAADSVNGLGSTYSFLPGGYSIPKTVMLSRAMSELKTLGVYFPFTFEANVNIDAPDCAIPFTMCHELAHVRGFMHEQDANFIAYLSCTASDSAEFRYSGYLMAIMYASSPLQSASAEKYTEFCSYLSSRVRRDLAAYSSYWAQFDTPVAKAASSVNDKYLKINSQSEGVKSYGGLTDLVIAHYYTIIKNSEQ